MTHRLLNLASEPIEDVQYARRVVAIAGAAVLALTLVHGGLLWWLQGRAAAESAAEAVPAVDEATLNAWASEVDGIVAIADIDRARGIINAVQQGNQLIVWRTIPWAAIFSDLEGLLPDGVRLESVQPGVDGSDHVRISMQAVAADPGPLQDLLIRLEGHARFADVLPQREETDEAGTSRLLLQVRYVPEATP